MVTGREYGSKGAAAGGVIMAIGGVLTATGVGAPVGSVFLAAGSIIATASSIVVAMNPPSPEEAKKRREKGHLTPPPIGDDNVIYGNYGRQVIAPVLTQAYLTPVDKKGELISGPGAVPAPQQGMSAMCTCGEGPYPTDWLEMIYINDQEIWATVTGEVGFTSDGATKKYALPRKGIRRESLEVYVGGDQKTANSGILSDPLNIGYTGPTGSSLNTTKVFTHTAGKGTIIDVGSVEVFFNNINNPVNSTTWPYTVQAKSDRKIVVKFANVPASTYVAVRYRYWLDDESIRITQDSATRTWVIFKTAPTQGTVVTYDAFIDNFPTLKVESRRGELNQSEIPGSNEVRNSFPVGDRLAEKEAITYTTERDVDDVSISISALQGMIRYGQYGAEMSSIARVTIDYRANGDTPWISLPNPKGDTSPEFLLEGETPLIKRWDVSIRETLKKAVETGQIKPKVLDDFGRDRYDIRVVRLDPETSVTTNQDSIWLSHVTEIQDEKLSYPGVAYFVIHGLATSKLRGSIPQITAKIKGRIVKNLDTEVEEWSQNPAWCLADLLTNTRFGAGVAEADLITQEWINWADWCDGTVELGDGTTETRCKLDAHLDTAKAPLAWLNDLAFGSFAVPVMKGKKWGVFIDKARTTDKTYTYSGATSNQEMDSLSAGVETRSKTPSEIEVQYVDQDLEYDPQEVLIPPPWRISTDRTKKTISLPGVTRRTQAIRVGERVLLSTQLQQLACEFIALPGGCLSEAGDVISVQSDVGGFATGKKFRVLRVGIDARCRVRLLCLEYSDQLYATKPYRLKPKQNARTDTNQRADGRSTGRKGHLAGVKPLVKLREILADMPS
jgi:hypothetical protein